jgi:hypothetical protein
MFRGKNLLRLPETENLMRVVRCGSAARWCATFGMVPIKHQIPPFSCYLKYIFHFKKKGKNERKAIFIPL